MSLTYSDYLKLDVLLDLQSGSQNNITNDELLFITIHQVCELWFKLLLDTLEKSREFLNESKPYDTIHALKRCRMIIKTLVNQMDIISTLSPSAFNQYRNALGTSSGLQSFQFREIEFLLGFKREAILSNYTHQSWEYNRLLSRLQDQTLNDALLNFLNKLTHHDDHPIKHETLISIYKNQPDIAILLDLMLDIDEGLQEWRYRHVKLVERIIGTKQGTGGTKGLEFLKATLFKPFFPELWEIRSFL